MTPSIPLGTLLRQRYAIQQVLGQGGFSRTYLALDLERFNEPCVLKELAVPQQDAALLEKAQALFQREASVLYQIQHPQIPRFLAAFEDNQRLFSVQEFVDGQTYRSLLQERKQQGQTFSELEVLQFLNHLLPVLTYIHDRNIIHRDISLENVMLRLRDHRTGATDSALGLPVLIDFGAVKSVANYLYTAFPAFSGASHPSEITCVGKVGYAPPEQLQTGKVHPHSDLYALAASCLVLLTGKEPKTLLDSGTLDWQLQPYAQISDRFEAILHKMLSLRPGDRYQSAQAVLNELQPLLEGSIPATTLSTDASVTPEPASDTSSSPIIFSKARATERSDRPTTSLGTVQTPKSPLGSRKLWHRWVGLGVGLGMAVLLGLTVPMIWRLTVAGSQQRNEVWVSGTRIPQSEASQIMGADAPAGTTPSTVNQAEPIQFGSGAISSIIQGNLQNRQLKSYVLRAFQGQIMTVALTGSDVTMNVLGSDQKGIDAAAYQTQNWTGQLPQDDDYFIQVTGSGGYKLEVAITPMSQASPAIATPTQPMTRITIAPGATGAKVAGNVVPGQPRRYLLAAKRGQTGVIQVIQGSVQVKAIAPNGQPLSSTRTQSQIWRGKFPEPGDYILEITTLKPEKFTISLQLR